MSVTLSRKLRQSLISVGIALPVLFLFVLSVFSHRAVVAAKEMNERVSHLATCRDLAVQLLVAIVDNETGQRGFIITQDPAFLDPYLHALQILPSLRQRLQETITESEAHAQLQFLFQAVDARLSFSIHSVELQQAKRHDDAVALIATGQGKRLTDHVRAEEAKLVGELDRQLESERRQYLRQVGTHERISWLGLVLDGLFAVWLGYVLLRFRRAQQLLHVCAWSKSVQYEGEWVTFEEYLDRRFNISVTHGISPEEADKVLAQFKSARSTVA